MLAKLYSSLGRLKRWLLGQKIYASPPEVERAELAFYLDYIKPGMTVFDAGANVGDITLLFARLVGTTGHVHSFEACGTTFEKLSRACSQSNSTQVAINHKAVSDREARLRLHVYDEEHSGWNSLAARPLQNYGIDVKPTHIEEVEAVTIDGYCRENGISHIDLLKIDVEGAEFQVLAGARGMLETHSIDCCVFEFGATTFDMGNRPDDIKIYLGQLGYNIRNVVKGDPVFPGGAAAETACFSIHAARPVL